MTARLGLVALLRVPTDSHLYESYNAVVAPNYTYPVEHNSGLFKIELRICMNAACFGPFSGHPQACQYKHLIKEDITRQTLGGILTRCLQVRGCR